MPGINIVLRAQDGREAGSKKEDPKKKKKTNEKTDLRKKRAGEGAR